jgi:hypothetical protein
MHLPGFTAEAVFYASHCHYAGKESIFTGARLIPQQLNIGPIQQAPVNCDLARWACIQSAQGTGYDPSGWCDWYKANCITTGPGYGGGGDACPDGCWQNTWGGCVCSQGPKKPQLR